MKYAILLFLLFQITHGMDRAIGNVISSRDKDNLISINYATDVKEKEVVAVNTQGSWVYAWVQSCPDPTNGIWLGVVNWITQPGDTFRGQVRNFKDAVKKLPPLQTK